MHIEQNIIQSYHLFIDETRAHEFELPIFAGGQIKLDAKCMVFCLKDFYETNVHCLGW